MTTTLDTTEAAATVETTDTDTAANTEEWFGKTYELTRKNGNVTKVRFTKKRADILRRLLSGETAKDIIGQGFNKSTVTIVNYQARKLGLLNK